MDAEMGEVLYAQAEPGVVYLGYERVVPYNWDTMEPAHTDIAVKVRQIVDGNNEDAPLLEYDHTEMVGFMLDESPRPVQIKAQTFFGPAVQDTEKP